MLLRSESEELGKNHLLSKEIYRLLHEEDISQMGMDLNSSMVLKIKNNVSNNLLTL